MIGIVGCALTMRCCKLRCQEFYEVESIDTVLEDPLDDFPVLAGELERFTKGHFDSKVLAVIVGCLSALPRLRPLLLLQQACAVSWIFVIFEPITWTMWSRPA